MIFLLMKAAENSLIKYNAKIGGYNTSYLVDAAEKYAKASELCEENCGCDC
jgi:hypothetical protein